MSGEKSSAVEVVKQNSRHLRGTIAQGLVDPVTGNVADDDYQLLKFHGVYRQDNRDVRDERRRRKLEPDYQFMVRLRLPGGVLTTGQWLALDELARRYGDSVYGGGTLRITTRQSLQIHGVRKPRLRELLQGIHHAGLDTRGACGDDNRNVVCSVNPQQSGLHAEVYAQARWVSEHLRWQSGAYDEIWLGGEAPGGKPESEPLFGDAYLPRKFKVSFAVPPDNDVDVLASDLAFSAIVESGTLIGYNVAAGGGMGMTYGQENTWPRIASPIGYIDKADVWAVIVAVVGIQRDWGNRSDRSQARLKYTIDRHGLARFKAEVEKRLGHELGQLRPCSYEHNGDRFGWVEGENGNWHLTLSLTAGRIADTETERWRAGLRAIAEAHGGEFRLTTNQNLVVAGVAPNRRAEVDRLVEQHGLGGYRRHSGIRLNAMACVAFPTCGLAMAEAERYLPDFLGKIEARLDRHGLLQEAITLRLSGCPNGCARPYLGEIALTGKAPGRYNLYLGASFSGERMNVLYRENITEPEVLDALDPLFARFAAERKSGEHFGDFLFRAGVTAGGDFHHAMAT
ncbi:MAG: NADPH-dependent assimilatory sulfite reductase hemoprotein subunit [Gammaproteobacteria bacterium]